MKKSELLQNLKNNIEATQQEVMREAQKEKEIAKESAKKITSEILQIYKEELRSVPKDIKSYILKKQFWTLIMTAFMVISLVIVLGMSLYAMKLKKDIVKLNQAKVSLQQYEPYMKLDQVQMNVNKESNEIFIYSKSPKSDAYNTTNGMSVLRLQE